MSDDARRSLAEQHRQLLGALSGRGPAPPGFDAGRLALASRTLLAKRMRSVARQWPALGGVPGFTTQFSDYASRTPLPASGGSAADGRAFYEFLRCRNGLTDAARVEAAVDRLAFRFIVAARLAGPKRLAVAVRIPWFRSRAWLIQL